MTKTYFMNNPFWRNQEKTEAMSILVTEDETGNRTNEQFAVQKFDVSGLITPMWTKLMEEQGPEVLDRNTEERRIRKIRESNEENLKKIQKEKSKNLENLFALKLKCFEIQEVRECSDRYLKSKLRGSRNEIEMQAWVSIILMKTLDETNDEN